MISIIPYESQHADIFKALNLLWLDQFGLIESHDLLMLNDPQGIIIDSGGYIFLAEDNGKIEGTAALIKTSEFDFELAKMTVDRSYRGKGISKLLLEKCIHQAKAVGATHLHLLSNHQLKEAIGLYEKYGFRHTPVKNAPYLSADVSMELDLTGSGPNKIPDGNQSFE